MCTCTVNFCRTQYNHLYSSILFSSDSESIWRRYSTRPSSTVLELQLYKVQQFRCYRSGLRHLLGEYGGIEADRQTNSSRQQAAADS